MTGVPATPGNENAAFWNHFGSNNLHVFLEEPTPISGHSVCYWIFAQNFILTFRIVPDILAADSHRCARLIVLYAMNSPGGQAMQAHLGHDA
jgi:hypothetical protein